jgi:copper chaperone CopZ
MKKIILPLLLLISTASLAEEKVFNVQGMSCGSCVKSVKSKVCAMDGLTKCEISVGKVALATKEGVALDAKKVAELVAAAGEYKVEEPKADAKKETQKEVKEATAPAAAHHDKK